MLLADKIVLNLCDRIPEDCQYAEVPDLAQIGRIETAKKFYFRPASMVNAYALFSFPDVSKLEKFLTLPYDLCWFECDIYPHDGSGHRDGYLCERTQDGIVVDYFNCRGLHTFWLSGWLATSGGPLSRMLLALNVRGAAEQEPVDKTEHNRARAHAGKPPLNSHVVCHVRPVTRRMAVAAGDHQSPRRWHEVRCHHNHRGDRSWLVDEYERGNAALGIVTKSYVV